MVVVMRIILTLLQLVLLLELKIYILGSLYIVIRSTIKLQSYNSYHPVPLCLYKGQIPRTQTGVGLETISQ